MASKEATVYIVDVGSTMGEKSHGRPQTNLDWALEYVWDRITTTVATGRKTTMAGVVALRTDGTANSLGDDDAYQHISILKAIDQLMMPDIRKLRSELVVSNTPAGDAVSALVIAIQMISDKCKKLQYIRKIVMVTDARAAMETDDLPSITKQIKAEGIGLTVLGVDFDDAEYGFKEESKDATKGENETILRTLCQDCDGSFGTLAEAIDEMQTPRLKTTRPVASFKGLLTLGNQAMFNDAFSIDVERYPKTMKASAPTASSFVLRSGVPETTQTSATLSNGDTTQDGGDGLSGITNARTYQVDDETAPGGKKDVERDELSKGYEYGRTAVHIAESDQNVIVFETTSSLDIIGFVDMKQYQRYMDMNRASLIVAQRNTDKASMALSSLIHALYEAESYAVARLVPKENMKPKLILLAPNIEPDFECLYDVELPFAEDVRNYRFPPLDRVLTVSGKELKVHRNLPSDDLLEAMNDYVDSMDLSTFGKDDEGNAMEYAAIDDTYNPVIQRINQVIKHRAVFPDTDPPPAPELATRYAQPPEELVEKAKSALDRLIAAGEVKKVPPKARGKRWNRKEAPKPLSDLDVAALLASDPKRKTKRIDPKNAIPEFKQLLGESTKIEDMHDACKQLKFIIFDWIKHSIGDSRYGQAVEGVRVMREEMIDMEEPAPFNNFMQELKKKIFGGELGGDRKEMWYRLRVNKLKPIISSDSAGTEMTEDEARKFMIPQ